MHFAPSCSTPASCRWQCSYLASGLVSEPPLTGKAKVGSFTHGLAARTGMAKPPSRHFGGEGGLGF